MPIIVVNNTAGLNAALLAAKGGETIQLAAGNYSGITVQNLSFNNAVTITSQDPAREAVVQDLMLKNVKGLTFQNLEFVTDIAKNPYWTFRVESSSNIKFDSLDVHGSLDNNPGNDAFAFSIARSTNVTVSNSEFHEIGVGINHMDSNNVTITGNKFHSIRWDGVDGGGAQGLTITQNYFSDFHPREGEHPDAIQVWTTSTTRPSKDIVIADNVVVRGEGVPIQGIFLQDERGDMPFQNVKITGNIMVGTSWNGITVKHGEDVIVTGNKIVGLPDQLSWFRMENVNNLKMSSNEAPAYGNINVVGLVESGNVTNTALVTDGGTLALKTWMSSHSSLLASRSIGGFNNPFDIALNTAAKNAIVNDTVRALNGTVGADRLTVDGVHDTKVSGGGGNDYITGGGVAHNTLAGGAGDDTYIVKSAKDTVVENAGEGNDTVTATVDFVLPDNVEVLILNGGSISGTGNALSNRLFGSAGNETISGMAGDDNIQSGAGNDLVRGGIGSDTVTGGAGTDTVQGDAGDDRLFGDAGSDSIVGGVGNDLIEGGAGADTMSGGAGSDSFIFRESVIGERISDFNAVDGDKINLYAIDANSMTTANEAFTFIGTSAFHNKAGELRYEVQGGNSYLMGDTNGDGIADLKIFLDAVKALKVADFLL